MVRILLVVFESSAVSIIPEDRDRGSGATHGDGRPIILSPFDSEHFEGVVESGFPCTVDPCSLAARLLPLAGKTSFE